MLSNFVAFTEELFMSMGYTSLFISNLLSLWMYTKVYLWWCQADNQELAKALAAAERNLEDEVCFF